MVKFRTKLGISPFSILSNHFTKINTNPFQGYLGKTPINRTFLKIANLTSINVLRSLRLYIMKVYRAEIVNINFSLRVGLFRNVPLGKPIETVMSPHKESRKENTFLRQTSLENTKNILSETT